MISPKVYIPTLVNLAVGLLLIAVGEHDLGVGVLLAAASGAGLGYAAPHKEK